ncbi:hypothetical protein DFH09DRAFT_1334574 [Mycena vulgaris]|nr:hypothetical protein DFH09DRAFT_1334574 [Mycena vulgaris]
MDIDTFTLLPPGVEGSAALSMAAKRYRHSSRTPQDGVTLIMLHALGQHKEQWEPVIDTIYALHSGRSSSPQIREVSALDWQSHGDSAVINREVLEADQTSARPTVLAVSLEWN